MAGSMSITEEFVNTYVDELDRNWAKCLRLTLHRYTCGHKLLGDPALDFKDGVLEECHNHPCPECGGHR